MTSSSSPPKYLQDSIHQLSLADPEAFWSHQASQLHWHTPPRAALHTTLKKVAGPGGNDNGNAPSSSPSTYKSWTWFPGGEISTCYNCLDRHVLAGAAARPAILYDSPVTDTRRVFTYGQLLGEVEVLAGVLLEEGVKRGDVVMVYMPMIPAALIALLAINRLGAIHTVVFGGFAPPALAQRIDACGPVAILTASAGIDGTKPPAPYRPLVRGALRLASHRPSRVLVWQRQRGEGSGEHPPHPRLSAAGVLWTVDEGSGERDWQALVADGRRRGVAAACVPVRSDEPVYVIHTSGTTGRPKGVVRESGGHAVGTYLSTAYVYGIRGPGDVVFTASDIGWVVGHAYILYGPLMRGAASVLYEGKPVGTPDASAFWRIVEDYGVKTVFAAPTALRAVSRDDPDGELVRRVGARGGLRTLRALFLAGERSEPSLVTGYQRILEPFCAPGLQVIDHWWTTEVGSPVTARVLCPDAAVPPRAKLLGAGPGRAVMAAGRGGDGNSNDTATATIANDIPPLVPGSAGRPMPGFDLRIVDDDGAEVPSGEMGNVVLGLPLAPSAFATLWQDEGRFWASYLRRFGGRWLDTGDGGFVDKDGNIVVMGRNDDVLNVSAHRLSSGAIEQAITTHPEVAEAYVVPAPDPIKGQLPFAFLVLSTHSSSSSSSPPSQATPPPALLAEVQSLVRTHVGAIASLGGAVVCGRTAVPRTRSGKTLRRVLRDVLSAENGEGGGEWAVKVPDTAEDAGAVDEARRVVRSYFEEMRSSKAKL